MDRTGLEPVTSCFSARTLPTELSVLIVVQPFTTTWEDASTALASVLFAGMSHLSTRQFGF